MFGQTLAIARNTFAESIRQPIVLVMLVIATLLIVLSNPFAAFTMQDDQRMFIDIGLSTVFMSSILLAAFIATNVVNREIENRTVLTVVSKPVSRVIFIVGKYLGVSAALLLSIVFLAFVFMLVERHGPLQTTAAPYHYPVLVFGIGAVAIGLAVGTWSNYFYDKAFTSSTILAATPLVGLAYLHSLFFSDDWTPVSMAESFEANIWLAIGAMTVAVLILTAIAVAASTRLGQVLTVAVTIGVFLLGMLSDWLFGRQIAALSETFQRLQITGFQFDGQHLLYLFCKVMYAVVPNFQVFWLADALTQRNDIPLSYIASIVPYGALYVVVALALAVALFQRREVG